MDHIDYSEGGQTFSVSFLFCPNTGDAAPVLMRLPGKRTLDGDIWIERIQLAGKTYWPHRGGRRPKWITAELLERMRWAAAEAEYKEQRTTLEKFYGRKLRWR